MPLDICMKNINHYCKGINANFTNYLFDFIPCCCCCWLIFRHFSRTFPKSFSFVRDICHNILFNIQYIKKKLLPCQSELSHMNMMVEDIKSRELCDCWGYYEEMTHFQLTSRYTLNLFNNIPLFEEIRERKWNEMIHRGIIK